MIQNIQDLENTKKGSCIIVGHGSSINQYPWYKVQGIPKILVNFYDSLLGKIIGCVCWDKDILKNISNKIAGNKINKPNIYYSGSVQEHRYDVFLDPYTFPPKIDKDISIYSGGRAIYLSQYLGYSDIYLIGFDYKPHIQEKNYKYEAQEKEYQHCQKALGDISQGLKTQMENFKYIKWLHNNIYQTNKDSELKFFKYKLLEQ